MRTIIHALLAIFLVAGPVSAQQAQTTVAGAVPDPPKAAAEPQRSEAQQLREEIDLLKKTIGALEQRLEAQEKRQTEAADPVTEDTVAKVKELDRRVMKTERDTGLNRVRIGGDYRFEAHSIQGEIPDHVDGMKLQNLLVQTLFASSVLGRPPQSIDEISGTVAGNYSQYQQFTQNLTFDQLKAAMAQVPPEMQQQLFGLLIPAAYTPGYSADNAVLYTNRFRIKLDTQVAPNLSLSARLSMYKVFGDSAGVQVFNGQPTSLNIDGTTAGVPNGDMLRVERAYFTWNNINDSKFFLSIGRRPSTGGPPLNLSEDEARGGTPSGALINYQFDGITFGYKMSDQTILRACYGVGYESGFGSGDILKRPEDRLDDVHFLGANVDFWTTDKTLIQGTFARAFNVTDGFNGLTVLPNNPLTGEPVGAPVVMRFTPSTNLGDINLAGANVEHRFGSFDTMFSLNYVGFYPEPVTTPFGGMVSDPFEVPETHHGWMLLTGLRYNFGNDERSKIGFEYNHGSKYWFNFAQAEDEIIAPKTSARGDVFEGYFTHRINDRFIFKADYIRYNYNWSGSGWHLGAPKALDGVPILGFPTYEMAQTFTVGLMVRF